MRSLKYSFGIVSIVSLSSAAVISGCSASGSNAFFDPTTNIASTDPAEDASASSSSGMISSSPSSSSNSSSSSSSSSGSSGRPVDAGPKVDAGRPPVTDAGGPRDAAVEAGPATSLPGTKCARLGDLFEERCGFCGTRQSVCDGGEMNPTWTDFGPCIAEVTTIDRCVPGEISSVSCGICGSKTLVCQNDCHPAESACLGEKIGGCAPGEIGYTTAACMSAGTFREHKCNDTCSWNAPAPLPCKPKDGDIIASAVVDGEAFGIGKLEAATTIASLTIGKCGTEDVIENDTEMVPYTYSVVRNPLDKQIKVEVFYATPAGGRSLDTVTAAYAGKSEPSDRLECLGEVNDYCSDPSCDDNWSGLLGENAVVIEPRSYIIVYTAAYSSGESGAFKMIVRTKEIP